MAHLPTTAFALATTLALAAGVAEAKPHRGRPRPPAARPLLRATPAPAAAVSQPRVSASERPVCGNIATKGPPQRRCTDAVGESRFVAADDGSFAFADRTCHRDGVAVTITADRTATIGRIDPQHGYRSERVAANATSTEPLVAACRRGLP